MYCSRWLSSSSSLVPQPIVKSGITCSQRGRICSWRGLGQLSLLFLAKSSSPFCGSMASLVPRIRWIHCCNLFVLALSLAIGLLVITSHPLMKLPTLHCIILPQQVSVRIRDCLLLSVSTLASGTSLSATFASCIIIVENPPSLPLRPSMPLTASISILHYHSSASPCATATLSIWEGEKSSVKPKASFLYLLCWSEMWLYSGPYLVLDLTRIVIGHKLAGSWVRRFDSVRFTDFWRI